MAKAIAAIVMIAAVFDFVAQTTPSSYEPLIKEGKYKEALSVLSDRLKADPDNPILLYNAGLTAYLGEEHATAIKYWQALKLLDPKDWQVRTKLVQAYEANKERGQMDKEIKELYEMRKAKANKELSEAKFYCRDQFKEDKTKVMVFEYFELEGERAKRWSFNVLNEKDETDWVISLGSYEMDTQIGRETGDLK